jgi:molybdopterin-binding protein
VEISARNQIQGTVKFLRLGDLMAEVEVTIDPAVITALITAASVERLNVKPGDRVTVIVKSTEVMIGKQ